MKTLTVFSDRKGQTRLTVVTGEGQNDPTPDGACDPRNRLRRNVDLERLFRLWVQLRREYWLSRRPASGPCAGIVSPRTPVFSELSEPPGSNDTAC
jgi:hypothetical protein